MKSVVRKILTLSLITLIVLSITPIDSLAGKGNEKDGIMAKVGSETISYKKLEKAYQKNMNNFDIKLCNVSIDSTIDFLNLYTKYRLKVLDAIDRGYDKDSSVKADIEQNRKILAETFFYEKKLMNPWLNRMLELRNYEYKIAVMVFTFPPVQDADSMMAFEKANNCLNLLKNGADFATVAIDSSDDPETAKYGGEVQRWITSGNIQRPLENAIMKLDAGDFTKELIRTRYGYFIVRLLNKEKREFVKASHILFTYSEEDSTDISKLAHEVLSKIRNGEDFAALAKEYSQDKQSASEGGSLNGYYSRSSGYEETFRRLVPAFENALFSIKDGEVSDLAATMYGFHIIKREDTKGIDEENDLKELKSIYRKSYYQEDKKKFLDSVYKAYGFKINDETIESLVNNLDTNKTNLQDKWFEAIPNDSYNKILFEFLGKSTSVGEFIKKMQRDLELRGMGLNRKGILKAIDKIVSPMVLNEATKTLEKEYPDFSALMQEFMDGILLFKVEQIEVWDKLKFDSSLAKVYWDSTKTRYKTQKKFDISEIYVLNDSIAKNIYKKLNDGADFEELAKINTQRSGYREKKGAWGSLSESNALAKIAIDLDLKSGELGQPMQFEKGYSIVKLNEIIPVRQKTFEEAIPDFAPAFQDLMQKNYLNNWLDSVEKKFPIRIYKDKIITINKKLK